MLTTEEIRLLRSLVEWRRATGWTLGRHDFTYISPDRKAEFWPGWGKELGDRMFITYPDPEPGQPRERVIPPCISLREAVDVLVVFGLLPVEFSSAFQAGRESAYTEDEWRVNHPEGGPGMYWGGLAEHLTELLDACRSSYPEAWIEHRRTGATEWVRVSVSQRTEAQ